MKIPRPPAPSRILLLVVTGALAACAPLAGDAAAKPNVLFLVIDDLRPQLGCYGDTAIKTPNIDRLAERGLVFERAYCQMAICMASRASVLTGYRPDRGEIFRNGPALRHVPDALTIISTL